MLEIRPPSGFAPVEHLDRHHPACKNLEGCVVGAAVFVAREPCADFVDGGGGGVVFGHSQGTQSPSSATASSDNV